MTAPEPFFQRLSDAIRRKQTPVMVGLDPNWDQIPPDVRAAALAERGESLEAVARAYRAFCLGIIEVVAELVPVVKFQAAFFEAAGPAGMLVLAELMTAARDAGLLVVLDGKRNDIGNTAAAYAKAYLGSISVGDRQIRPWGADALTVNPFLGGEGIEPFLEEARANGAGIFVLVRTSNPGAGRLQDLHAPNKTIYQTIADWVEEWSVASAGDSPYGAVGAVVGATVPEQVVELRARMPHAYLLLPGYGAQGGCARDTAAAFDSAGLGAVVNNSRGILFAYRSEPYQNLPWRDAARAATSAMIDDLARHTPAGLNRRHQPS